MVLTGNSIVKFGIKITFVALKIEISNFNVTLEVFIPNFTATHEITSTNTIPVSLQSQ